MNEKTTNSEQQASSRVELLTLKQDIVDILTRFRFQFKKPTTTPAFQRIALDEAIESIELLTENAKHDGYNNAIKTALGALSGKLDEDGSQGKWVNGYNDSIDQTRTNLERLLK